MKKIETVVYTLPAFWASALINGDDSGMSDQEIDELRDWHRDRVNEYSTFHCVDVSNENEFGSNDANSLKGAVADFTFHVGHMELGV